MGRPAAKAKAGTSLVKKGQVMKAKGVKKIPDHLLTKGRCDKKDVKKVTSMTTEQWQNLQKGMDAKWPLPAYMKGQKGHMSFMDETYSQVTRWTAATKIAYRPHAKRPGSKSHLRYELYSKAKTIGEALKLGSYPADWCWDLERGFIKVLGGPVREEPLDIEKATVNKVKVTEVDKAIHGWYTRELARRLGLSVAEVKAGAGCGEGLELRGRRLLAQKEAKEILEKADREGKSITEENVLDILQRWVFFRNPWRQNVNPDGQSWVFSDTLGLVRDRQGHIHRTAMTRRYPQVAELIARWLTDRLPKETKDFTFTSINLNCNYAARMHRDNGNLGPSFIKAVGDFTGGNLNYWPEDSGGKLEQVAKKSGESLDIKKGLCLFNGNCAHSVDDFTGTRYSMVYFTLGCHNEADPKDKEILSDLCFPIPGKTANPYKWLRPPRGYGAGAAKSKKGELPALRYWNLKGVKDPSRPKLKVAKKRVLPETSKSFYSIEWRREQRAKGTYAGAKPSANTVKAAGKK